MPSKSRIPRKFIFSGGLLIVAAGIFFVRPSGESAGKENRIHKSERAHDLSTGNIVNRSPQAPTHRPDDNTETPRNLKTKASDRPSAGESRESKRRAEFWRGAKLPEDLVAATLPVLRAAEPPSAPTAPDDIDFTTEVPGAFGDGQEKFDYKRANELLYLWMSTEPDAASAWISGQADFSTYDMAFGMIADSMAHAGYPDIGNQWVDLIPSPEKREDARVGMYAGMYSRGEEIPREMVGKVANSDKID